MIILAVTFIILKTIIQAPGARVYVYKSYIYLLNGLQAPLSNLYRAHGKSIDWACWRASAFAIYDWLSPRRFLTSEPEHAWVAFAVRSDHALRCPMAHEFDSDFQESRKLI